MDIVDRILLEGVTKNEDGFSFNFNEDNPNDILNLKFRAARNQTKKVGECTYTYYYAYQLSKSENSGELMKAIKSLDQSISSQDLDLFVNKAVMGFNSKMGNAFDTIITPKSSSIVLDKLANQLQSKMGNAELFSNAFVKSANTDITFDMEKVNKLPEKSKEQFMKMYSKVIASNSPFKMKEIFSPYRKFFTNFIKFNSENDRRLYNAVNGKNVVIIDDYRTTGTTVTEMLRQVINAGATNIAVFIMLKVS